MNRTIIHRALTAAAATSSLALAAMAGNAFAAEVGAAADKTTVTTRTTTVSTETTPAAASALKHGMDRDEMRIRSLHDQLKVTAAQEPLWADVEKVMRSNDENMDGLTSARHDKAATMTAVEDLRSYGEITEQHAIGIKTFVPVFEKLYDSMSPAQKANADQLFRAKGHKHATKAK